MKRFTLRKSPSTNVIRRWELPAYGSGHFWQRLRPEQLFVSSFLALIVICAAGLHWVDAFYAPGHAKLDWIDSLFTATSAVCVTGLIVVDTATHFSFSGQLWILLFIQLGGLGVITLSSMIILALGGRLSLRSEALSTGSGDVVMRLNRAKLIRDIVLFTLLIEAIGFVVLWSLWAPYDLSGQTWWHALFHSISAFCNAGFSTYSDSVVSHRHSSATLLVIGGLIILGGIGFLTLEELYIRSKRRRNGEQKPRLSLHARIVLCTTALLLIGGWIGFGLLEWSRTLNGLAFTDKLSNSLFMSITARTAGFNSIDYAEAHAGSNFMTILLMSVGGSPGSTAGGIKTTTFALIGLLAWAKFRRRGIVSLSNRTIPDETIQRAVGLLVFAFSIVTIATFILVITENRSRVAANEGSPAQEQVFFELMFEAVSAFNTVGLSMGVTADLSDSGRLLMTVLMLLGRVGPLTFAAAIALSDGAVDRRFRYAKEDVVIG